MTLSSINNRSAVKTEVDDAIGRLRHRRPPQMRYKDRCGDATLNRTIAMSVVRFNAIMIAVTMYWFFSFELGTNQD